MDAVEIVHDKFPVWVLILAGSNHRRIEYWRVIRHRDQEFIAPIWRIKQRLRPKRTGVRVVGTKAVGEIVERRDRC